ncbi:MAG: dUTP diphosphatase [Tissierellia bacterium]|nr:dUTP diphosphatase [Tissierellia bacterium]
MKLKIINKSHHPLPEYKTPGSAGMDLRAYLEEPVVLGSLERRLIPTGLFIELPKDYEAQIRPRSGMSIKHGLSLINAIGTIDSDYRGELMIPLVNLSKDSYELVDGERIAQLVISPVVQAELVEVDQLDETHRADGGFGSTGKL